MAKMTEKTADSPSGPSNPANPSNPSNRLAAETSPYLQQHATNPVDWYPWGEAALAAARVSGRPILLSVGYSACHWCHVMAHECFEDDETAALMNRHFINIKVDREERPDIDQIYQSAHQLIARGPGGWPLTMFLTPEGKPFYGGTYFPKRPRYGRPGFDQLLARISAAWDDERDELLKQGDALVRALESTVPAKSAAAAASPDAAADLEKLATRTASDLIQLSMQTFDSRHGGFGGAPKFPHPSTLDALLRLAVTREEHDARDAVLLTLRKMAEGGLYDQLGGGFYRYSTDERWMIPHFEKMLYDNGPLLRLYAEAWQLTRDPLFRDACAGTASWLMREMQSPEGGYYSSFDADSEGEEGRFYVWDREAIETGLGAHLEGAELAAFSARYGLDQPPNFEKVAWHLHVARPLAEVASATGLGEAECAAAIERARARLFALRAARVPPGRDDKILTSWNALAIDGMMFASRVFGEAEWAVSARRALDFIRSTMWRDGRLLATYKDGHAHLNAYLDDHAFLLAALLEAMQRETLERDDVAWAREIADLLLQQFEDIAGGGFFFTSHDHETLVVRPKPGYDGATPSGNGMAALHLQRIGHLAGDSRYLLSAEHALALFAGEVSRVPHGYPMMVSALDELRRPPPVVILTGPPEDSATLAGWRSLLAQMYVPGLIALQLGDRVEGLPETIVKPRRESVQAWICRGAQCLPPVAHPQSMIDALG